MRTSARKILCTDWEVRESDRAGLDKKAPLAPCAVAMLDALGAVGKPSDEALIKEIVDRYGSLKGVAAAAAAASDQLKKNETP